MDDNVYVVLDGAADMSATVGVDSGPFVDANDKGGDHVHVPVNDRVAAAAGSLAR